MPDNIRRLECVDDLLQRYQTFLVDQFGVLHDGYQAFPGAVDALRTIKQAGATVIIISNSGKRANLNDERMLRLGFEGDCYDRLVSSGEVAWHLLKDVIIGTRVEPGVGTYILANDSDRSAIDGLELRETRDLSQAGLLLLTGQLLDEQRLRAVCESLLPAIEAGVLCVCTNPDKIAFGPNGKAYSTGTIAQWYQDNGGEVLWLGKPYPEIYQFIFRQERIENKGAVACIGDSVEHDIAGGIGQGIDAILVRTGIYDHLTETELQSVFEQHQAWPTYIISALSTQNKQQGF